MDEKGFTLIDLTVGVMIIAIIGLVASPHFMGFLQRFRLNGAVRVVWGDLQKARIMAIKEGRTIRVDFTNTSYEIVRVSTGDRIFTRNFNPSYPGVNISISNNTISFGSSGTAGSGSKNVEVQNSFGIKRFTVLTTGRIGNII